MKGLFFVSLFLIFLMIVAAHSLAVDRAGMQVIVCGIDCAEFDQNLYGWRK